MKLERNLKRRQGSLILEMTPLIDVVFLLLIFFLVATTTEDLRSGIKIELPQSSSKEVTNAKELQITIADDKDIYLSYKDQEASKQIKIEKSALKEELKNRLSETEKKNVLISADKKVDYGYVVEIMSIAKESGASSLDIDTANVEVSR